MDVQLYGKAYSTDITELNLSSKDLKYMDPNIKYLKNLRELYLYNNKITSICPEIGQLTNLQILYLYKIGRAHV